MIKFTPKPWKIVVYEADIHNFDPSHRQERQNIWSLGGKLAELYNRPKVGIEKTRANAQLMVVAPDMYDLLTKVLTGNQATMKERVEIVNDIKAVLSYVDGTGLKP